MGKGKDKRASHKYNRNKWWNNIVNKCGFSVEFVEKGLSEDDAYELEIETIKFYKDNGHQLCNVLMGGRYGVPEHYEKTEKRVAVWKSRKGTKMSQESRDKMKEAHKGRTVSKETRRKSSLSKRVPVCCSNGLDFISAIEAGEWVREMMLTTSEAAKGNICAVCLGLRKSAFGFIWKYKNPDDVAKRARRNKEGDSGRVTEESRD